GKVLNKRLSSDRAQAVKEYLISNNDGQPMNIKAMGYDYQKPLASNKTISGRAQNRRVDVLITADNSKVW
ncbi:MAG: OmpA family protein, partial [Bacteriovoracaceae bacterium]|nr:OmpA family protein [Bacteriovoracaceae bacterium]